MALHIWSNQYTVAVTGMETSFLTENENMTSVIYCVCGADQLDTT